MKIAPSAPSLQLGFPLPCGISLGLDVDGLPCFLALISAAASVGLVCVGHSSKTQVVKVFPTYLHGASGHLGVQAGEVITKLALASRVALLMELIKLAKYSPTVCVSALTDGLMSSS